MLLVLFGSDLSNHGEIQNVIVMSFSSHNEEVKSAASYALGNIRGIKKFIKMMN